VSEFLRLAEAAFDKLLLILTNSPGPEIAPQHGDAHFLSEG
jgi:hypothetical protein